MAMVIIMAMVIPLGTGAVGRSQKVTESDRAGLERGTA